MTTPTPPYRSSPRPARNEGSTATARPARSRPRTVIGWLIVGGFLTVIGLFGFGYVTTSIPSPSSIATDQTSIVTFADGRTELARVGSLNRIDVPLSKVPLSIRRAVLAAEDRKYYTEPGVSPQGIARALWANVRGGGISQGGSTITQQYAKNAFLTQQRTVSRKIREVFIAVKLDQERSKDRILEDYLNTIYFGRGAYGISTAAEAYFGRPVSTLTVAQGAVLASVIRAPSLYDPARHPAAATARWHYVLDGMVKEGWLPAANEAALRFPRTVKPSNRDTLGGPDGHLLGPVLDELKAHGFDEDRLAAGGYRVVTTIDSRLQKAAIKAEEDVLGSRNEPVSGLAAVQPGTGAIVAMYGGRNFTGKQPAAQINLAENNRPPGSSFKPYTLATVLSQGTSLRTAYNGTSPLAVPGWGSTGDEVHNDSGEQCPRCDLVRATALSVNTVYAQLVMQAGPNNVAKLAKAAGVSAPLADRSGVVPPSITLGSKSVSALDQAAGYATFAAGGEAVAPHIVARVLNAKGHAVYTAAPAHTRAFSAEVAADATYALTKVVAYGTGTRAALDDGRPVAGKTGTTTGNTDAWFVGFTPQLSAAVWLGNVDNRPLTNVAGYRRGIYGGQLPAEIWKAFMTEAMRGSPVKDFPNPVYAGTTSGGLPPPPPPPSNTPSPSPSGSPSASPTPSVTPSVTPSGRTPSSRPSKPTPSPGGSTRAPVTTSPSA